MSSIQYLDKAGAVYLTGKIKDLAGTKVDKVEGKGLSTNDYSDAAVAEVAKIADKVDKVNGKGLSSNDYTDEAVAEVAKIANKVDQVPGKSLSTNDYTDEAVAEVAKIADKVDKIAGKGLSANDYTDAAVAEVAKIADKVDKIAGKGLSTNDYDNDAVAEVAKIANKVDKVEGKGLSTNDYDNEAVTKLAGIEEGAQKNIAPDTLMSDSSENAVQNKVIKNYVDTAIGQITGIEFEVVDTLPATGRKGTIYLKPNSGSAGNVYDEFIYVSDKWELIGTTEVDLSGYVKSTDLVAITNAEIDAMFS